MTDQLCFIFDINRCSGCMACVTACQDQNDLPGSGPAYRRVTGFEESGPPAIVVHLSLSCQHCGDAPCLMVCPTGAIFRHKTGGLVDVDRDLCVGCRSCALACPFGAVHFLPDGKMAKCHFCRDRMARGNEPACIRACPTRALSLGSAEGMSQAKASRASHKILKTLVHSELRQGS